MKLSLTMKLHYKHIGEGPVLIILHGLFGSLDNWQSMVKKLSDQYSIYSLDLRNHGKSPHSSEFSMSLMADDVYQFMQDHHIPKAHIMGHSMGGKVVLQLLKDKNPLIEKSIVLDISPKQYPKAHERIFEAMFAMDLSSIENRKQADFQLMDRIPEFAVRQFLLKNLERNKEGIFDWKFNLNVLHEKYDEINKEISFTSLVHNEVLFVKGNLSSYILREDEKLIKLTIPNARFIEVEGAGHWIHADKPEELLAVILKFINPN